MSKEKAEREAEDFIETQTKKKEKMNQRLKLL